MFSGGRLSQGLRASLRPCAVLGRGRRVAPDPGCHFRCHRMAPPQPSAVFLLLTVARTLAWRAARRGMSCLGRSQGLPRFPPRSPFPAPFAPDAESGPAPGTLIWGNRRDLGSLGFLQAVVTLAQGRCPAASCALGTCRACMDHSAGPASGRQDCLWPFRGRLARDVQNLAPWCPWLQPVPSWLTVRPHP